MPAKRSALVVEDDADIGQLLKFILEREGFEVEHLADGRAALARLASGSTVDLILLDFMLPFASGLEVLAAARGLDGWRQVPIIMLTAKSSEADIVQALDLGANDYVVKPFQPAELRARLRRLVPAG